jgi:asparagine synthase (glutamine-hydrolysing)
MSGIAGIIRFDGAPVEPGLVEKMTGLMPYRGPDGINHWVKGGVALGQCMLRTTPESLEENQPLCNEDESLVLVMDGRVDNWEELRRELLGRGAVLRTRADAELVLRAYEAWGRDCLAHIDGDFALVIWDARRREAFCARDRIGKKTFTYHWDGKRLAFASELHAILSLPGMREELNEGMLAEFLAMEWLSRDETFWKGIYRLVAAHRMTVGPNGPSIEQYWMPDLWQTLPYTRDEEYVEHYRALLFDVVRRMSRSHLPVAYEVSGGLDSSAIFAVAEHLRRDGRLPAPAIEGYSLAFEDAPEAEEREYSRAVGEHLGVRIYECPATVKPLAWYREWARHYREFPGYPNGVMSLGLRDASRADSCRAVLGGDGGDDWLGMPWTVAYLSEELRAGHWLDVGATLLRSGHAVGARKAIWWFIRCGIAPSLPSGLKRGLRSVCRANRAKRSCLAPLLGQAIEQRRANPPTGTSLTARSGQSAQLAMLAGSYSAFAREAEERMAARLGLELRCPFMDSRIVQFAFSTAERLRSRGHLAKLVHRRALAGLLPKGVLGRSGKANFSVTLRGLLDTSVDHIKNHVIPGHGWWFRVARAQAVCDEYRSIGSRSWRDWWLCGVVGCDALIPYSSVVAPPR